MDKKDKLEQGTIVIQKESEKSAKPTWLGRFWNWLVTRPRAIWNWVRGINFTGLANIALLCLIIVLFSILVINLWDVRDSKNGRGGSTMFNGASADSASGKPGAKSDMPDVQIKTINVPATVTINKTADKLTVELPLRKIMDAADAIPDTSAKIPTLPLDKSRVNGNVYLDNGNDNDIVLDGQYPDGSRLQSMRDINGNVYLQNMRYYTLPCGVRINGNLFVRNVGQLRFCGCFEVNGNIYVSTNSSFGPMPAGSRVSGQVIF